MKISVTVTLKKEVLDPQGKVVGQTLNNMGYKNITNVRQGKYFEIDIDENNKEKADNAADHIIFLGILLSLFFILFGYFFGENIIRYQSNDPSIMEHASDYFFTMLIGTFFMIMSIFFRSILSASVTFARSQLQSFNALASAAGSFPPQEVNTTEDIIKAPKIVINFCKTNC
mgnify:CR=1 FL=1